MMKGPVGQEFLLAALGGKRTLANGANSRDPLAAVGPMLKRGCEATGLASAELHSDVVATSTHHELKTVWAGHADLQPIQRCL